jgi:Tol biopolymer transport system component
VHDLEYRPMPRMSSRRSYRLRIATAVAMAMLSAGCGSSPDAGPTEPNAKVDAGTTTQAAATPSEPAAPPPSPARSGSLAYGVDGDIYVADWDGSNPVRIAAGRYWGEGSIWSPDGRYLAFRDPSRDVVISDPDGDVIAQFPAHGWDIAWSPDSTRVAVWIRFGETIAVFGVDGRQQALLTMPRGWRQAGDHDPKFSPDGGSLLLQGLVIPIDGSTPFHRPLSWGTYSPDGSRVAKATRESLVVAEADGSNPRAVFDGNVWNPVWSPTGDGIAFTTWKRGSGGESQLRLLDVATGAVTLLAEADGSDMLEAIDFSPEGDRILLSRQSMAGPIGSLWSVRADGSDLRRLVAATSWGDWLNRPAP